MRKRNKKYIKTCYLLSNSVEPVPPIGTILGNLGVNTVKFCEEFNKKTENLPKYFLVKTEIYITENRTFKFKIKLPTICTFINLLKFERTIKIKVHDRYNDKIINCIKLKDVIQLALFKFPKKT